MKSLKKLFVITCTTIMVLLVFLICDTLFAGLIYLLVSVWSKAIALSVFKWVVIVMFVLQILFTIPVVIKGCKEGDEQSGT